MVGRGSRQESGKRRYQSLGGWRRAEGRRKPSVRNVPWQMTSHHSKEGNLASSNAGPRDSLPGRHLEGAWPATGRYLSFVVSSRFRDNKSPEQITSPPSRNPPSPPRRRLRQREFIRQDSKRQSPLALQLLAARPPGRFTCSEPCGARSSPQVLPASAFPLSASLW